MSIAFPLKLYLTVQNVDNVPSKPRLNDELTDWLSETSITDFGLEWRKVDESHPYFNTMPSALYTNKHPNAGIVDTWIIFNRKSDATLFKLKWGRYEGS